MVKQALATGIIRSQGRISTVTVTNKYTQIWLQEVCARTNKVIYFENEDTNTLERRKKLRKIVDGSKSHGAHV